MPRAPKPVPMTMRFSGRIYGGEDRDVPVMVTPLGQGKVRVSQHADPAAAAKYGPVMTRQAFKHFKRDVSGKLKLPPANRADIDAVARGEAELLGKGDDGIVYRVGNRVVKVSTTVPYQPFNPGHRTPQQAGRMLRRQAKLGNVLARAGVPHLQQSEFVWHGDRGFQIKGYVEIPEQLTAEQLADAHEALKALHARGYVLNDDVQIGVDEHGKTVLYDIGKVARAGKGRSGDAERDQDVRHLRYLYKKHHVPYPRELRPPSLMGLHLDMAKRTAQRLIDDGKNNEAIRVLLERYEKELLSDHPDDEHRELEDWLNGLYDDLGVIVPGSLAHARSRR